MPSSLVDLRPDRRLLDHEFEGYKLNLQALPQHTLDLVSPVDRLYPDDVQYSYVHAKLFALNNHLIMDAWDHRYSYYYFDKQQQVRNVTFDNYNNTFQNSVVYDVPAHEERKSGHFNLCLQFASSNVAVVSDGTGYIHIIGTGTRSRSTPQQDWQTLHSSLALGENKYFLVVNCRYQEKDQLETVHCLLQSVEQTEKQFDSILTWVTYENDGARWKQLSMRQYQGKGIVHYAALGTNCEALYVASDNLFNFTLDTVNEIVERQKQDNKPILYTWLQTSDDISITLKLEPNFVKNRLLVNVLPDSIKVSYAGKNIINGKLKHKVDSELTTWNVQDSRQVDILITKSDSMLWDEFLEVGDPNGEQIMDASLVEEVHKKLAHLCSETEVTGDQAVPSCTAQELEECDAASDEDTVLARMDIINHEITHRVPLSVHQYLFNIKLDPQEVPAVVLRHDVDAYVWQPHAQLIDSKTWPLTHNGTLMAFGYVQSSKQNRKFVTCAPNFLYSVVCEATRHVFIYQSASNQNSELRQRTGGTTKKIRIGHQRVINIDKYGEVLGIEATNDYLFLLTENTLIAIGIY